MLFVSICLFFNPSRSLLIDYCIFSILFSRFLIIFTLIILNSFSGSFPISSSFIWTSVFLVCYFISVVFLCLFIFSFFKTYCVWALLFAGFKVEFFLPFGFCLPKAGSVVCVSIVLGEIGAEFLSVFTLMGKAEWVDNHVCWWVALYFSFVCCLEEVSCTGCYWWLGDAGSCGSLCVSSPYLILPRVSSLVV